jgi:hypothetical protein
VASGFQKWRTDMEYIGIMIIAVMVGLCLLDKVVGRNV